ncbi:unnamed protein product [Gongylonema pulchrum]|uniref:Helitron helicase n=1 Tax=Gongylonema pulchrum TaxID=637853 RepID=A0A183EAJ7_9BILA|nr:unnamed protein product [Gongylonema pulchrum]
MILAASVNPYSNSASSLANHVMTITDVTDQYPDDDDGEMQEGSLVEYCRINHRENALYQPKICLADKVIKMTTAEQPQQHGDNFAKTVYFF